VPEQEMVLVQEVVMELVWVTVPGPELVLVDKDRHPHQAHTDNHQLDICCQLQKGQHNNFHNSNRCSM